MMIDYYYYYYYVVVDVKQFKGKYDCFFTDNTCTIRIGITKSFTKKKKTKIIIDQRQYLNF